MPYQESPYFKTPPPDTSLWRYMTIDKFMAMLSKEALYFSNVNLFTDRYEGQLSHYSRLNVHSENLFNEMNTPIKQDDAFVRMKKQFEETSEMLSAELFQESGILLYHKHSFEALLNNFSNHLMFCSSWFLKENESHSMWTEYGDKSPTSIAIQTTVGNLINSLNDEDKYHIHIGEVKYKDYKREHIEGYEDFKLKNLTEPDNVLELFYAPVMHKRDIYNDEHEVRALISFESICNNFTDRVYTSEIPFYSDRLFRKNIMDLDEDIIDDHMTDSDTTNKMKEIPTEGIHVRSNLKHLIKRVVMSPHANNYFYDPLTKLIENHSLDPDIIYFSDI